MIEPGTRLEIAACGTTFDSIVLSRKKQRELIGFVRQATRLDATVESLDKLYDIADQIVELVIPTAGETLRDSLQINDVLELANACLLAHMPDADAKKNSASQP